MSFIDEYKELVSDKEQSEVDKKNKGKNELWILTTIIYRGHDNHKTIEGYTYMAEIIYAVRETLRNKGIDLDIFSSIKRDEKADLILRGNIEDYIEYLLVNGMISVPYRNIEDTEFIPQFEPRIISKNLSELFIGKLNQKIGIEETSALKQVLDSLLSMNDDEFFDALYVNKLEAIK